MTKHFLYMGRNAVKPVFGSSTNIFSHILVLQEYRVLTKSRIPLKPVLRGVRIVALSVSSNEQTQCNLSLLFSYIVGSFYF